MSFSGEAKQVYSRYFVNTADFSSEREIEKGFYANVFALERLFAKRPLCAISKVGDNFI